MSDYIKDKIEDKINDIESKDLEPINIDNLSCLIYKV